MGMANSDDEAQIMHEHYLMEEIKKMTPEYAYQTHNMNEDMKAIYDHSLMHNYLHRNDAPQQAPTAKQESYQTKVARRDNYSYSYHEKDEYDKKIEELKKKIEIARLEKELEELTSKKEKV